MLNEVQDFKARLARADRAWQREKAWALLGRATPIALAAFAIALAADAFLQLSISARVYSLATLAAAITVLVAVSAWLGGYRRNPLERVARHLEQRDPNLGSALINTLQLTVQSEDPALAERTRRLAASAVSVNARKTDTLDLAALARTHEARRQGRRAAWAAVGFALLLAIFFPVTRVVVPRFLDPWGDHPPYAFTRVEILEPGDSGAEVIYGRSLPVKVRWSGHEPRELFLTAHPIGRTNEGFTLPLIREPDRTFSQEIPEIREDLVLVAHSRSRSFFSHQRFARVQLTPRIEKGYLQITPPAYTGLPSQERPFTFSSASALEGSSLRFRLRSNRPLRAGTAECLGPDDTARVIPLDLVSTQEVSGNVTLTASTRIRFKVTDVDGRVSESTPESLLTVTHDLPPSIRLLEPQKDGFVAQDYALNFRVEASDDYGIRTLRLHLGQNGQHGEPRTVAIDGIQRDASAQQPVDLASLPAKPGDKLTFFAEAIDTSPEPHVARTPTVTLVVVSTEDYNDFLREERDIRDLAAKYDELLEKYRGLLKEQNELAQAAAEAAKRAAQGDTNALRPDAFDALAARQNEINQRLEQQAREMERFVRPDPLYAFEKDLQKQLDDAAREIRASTAANQAALHQLARKTSPESAPRRIATEDLNELERQAREQAERLGAEDRDLAKQVQEPLEDLARLHDLVNDFNAVEELLQAQKQIADQAAAYDKRGPLNREDQLALKELAEREQTVRDVLDQLPGLLRRHANAAEQQFPKASSSGRKLADALEKARLAPVASQATQRMLEADGTRSAQLARRVQKGLEELFSQCQGNCPGESGDELDQFLKLTLGGSQQPSLDQMKQCRKLGLKAGLFPKPGQGYGVGSGSGYSQKRSPELAVLGNERFSQGNPKDTSTTPGDGNASGQPGSGDLANRTTTPGEHLRGLNPLDRQSAAVPTESSVEAYRAVVDEYFKALSRTP